MFSFIFSQFLFYIAIALVLFVPGYFLILATGLSKKLSSLESFVLAFGSSIVIVDFLIILLGKSPFHINRFSILTAIILFSVICYAIYFFFHKKDSKETEVLDIMPRQSAILVVLLIFLTIFIKTIYFTDTIFPTTTDLGHHMYWTKQIIVTGNLPQYEKADIGSDFTIGSPEPIADFIIGEHLIFAAINLLSGIDFISFFPALILFLVQIMSVLAIFILTREIFKKASPAYRDAISIMALFLIGPLYALASPQAKFVSGGVIGNTIGNLMIPLVIYFYIRALSEKKSLFLSLAFFLTFGLAYTHHLSMFVFIFAVIFTIIAFVILNFKIIKSELPVVLKLFISPSVLTVLAAGIIFIFFIYTPTYLNSSAINTAVGAPSKATRMGLTFAQMKSTAGETRYAFAFAGIFFLFFARKIGKYRQSFIVGWIIALALMSLKPDWLFIDIPSDRIASYIIFPVAIVAACMLVHIFILLKKSDSNDGKNYISSSFVLTIFFSFMLFAATNGFIENSQSLNLASSTNKALQTYAASKYLAQNSTEQDVILKDHNYLSGDSWIKLFFMRGYNYPLSRGYFKRYEDETKPREQCTNFMISLPNGPEAKQCFSGTKTDFIMINSKIDSGQFTKLREFWRIYSSDEVGIFYKNS